MTAEALCWFDGTIIPAREARVSVFDHGLLYGDGVFEGLRFYHGKVFRLDAHLQRLAESATAIALSLPYDLATTADAIETLLARYDGDDGYLRLVVTRGAGALGVDPRKCGRPTMFIIADQLQLVDADGPVAGISLHVAETRRLPAACLDPAIKSLNYLNNILAKIEANRAGRDEALMLNLDGHVSEGSVDNIFIVSDGTLATPALGDGLLAGITRAVVIDVAREAGIAVDEKSLKLDDLLAADECFLTGTGAELIPVASIGDHRLPVVDEPLIPIIVNGFRKRIARECLKQ